MRKKLICLVLFLCLFTGGCAAADGLTVTATFYPIYLAAINVCRGVEGVSVTCLAPPTAGCLHDYQITSMERRTLADSDVILANGAGLESFLEKLLPQLKGTVIEAAEGIELLPSHEDEWNPHVWVGVSGAIREAENIAAGLAAADPAHADEYAANCAAYTAKLLELKEETAAALAPCAGKSIVTFHEAFDYYAAEFGLTVAAVVQHEEGDAPSAREIAETVQIIREKDVCALFAEPQYTDESIDLIARETGLPVYLLDPVVSGEADPDDTDAYLRIMRQNLSTLLEALE